jgi:hypothetical protein
MAVSGLLQKTGHSDRQQVMFTDNDNYGIQ